PLRLQWSGTIDIVAVPRVATVDQRVAGGQVWRERIDRAADVRRGNHQPHVAGRAQCGDHVLRAVRPTRPRIHRRLYGCRVDVVGNTVVAGALQAPNHVGAHAPETDHRDLHVRKVATFARRLR